WFRERVGSTGRRVRKIMVVALARKLLIALWRFVIDGVVPEGAVLKPLPERPFSPPCAAPAEQSDDPRKRRRCSAWRYSAVYTEWCRSLGALPVPNTGQWLGSTPAGCEVCRGSPAGNESPTLDRDLPKSAL